MTQRTTTGDGAADDTMVERLKEVLAVSRKVASDPDSVLDPSATVQALEYVLTGKKWTVDQAGRRSRGERVIYRIRGGGDLLLRYFSSDPKEWQ